MMDGAALPYLVKGARAQAGVMLLEALIAILIFSLGILSLVALQTTSIQLTSDAKYRTDASFLANKLIGRMWVSGRSLAAVKTAFETDGAQYDAWLPEVQAALPGVVAAADGVDATLPTVTISDVGDVVITIFWRTPEMSKTGANSRHTYMVTTRLALAG